MSIYYFLVAGTDIWTSFHAVSGISFAMGDIGNRT